jgi:hypothetical protein
MSNTILNWRFGTRHLQIVRFRDWIGEIRMGRSPITFRVNPYQAWRRHSDPTWTWFEFM